MLIYEGACFANPYQGDTEFGLIVQTPLIPVVNFETHKKPVLVRL